jgi:hypothetical protein
MYTHYTQYGDENRGYDPNVSESDEEYISHRQLSLSEKLAKVAKEFEIDRSKETDRLRRLLASAEDDKRDFEHKIDILQQKAELDRLERRRGKLEMEQQMSDMKIRVAGTSVCLNR